MVKIRHFVVDVDKFLVLGNDSVLGEGIVINSSVCSHFSEKKKIMLFIAQKINKDRLDFPLK